MRRPGSAPWPPTPAPGGGSSFRDLLGPVDADADAPAGPGAGFAAPTPEMGAASGTGPFAPVTRGPFAPVSETPNFPSPSFPSPIVPSPSFPSRGVPDSGVQDPGPQSPFSAAPAAETPFAGPESAAPFPAGPFPAGSFGAVPSGAGPFAPVGGEPAPVHPPIDPLPDEPPPSRRSRAAWSTLTRFRRGAPTDPDAADPDAANPDAADPDSDPADGVLVDGAPFDGAPFDGAPFDGAPFDGALVDESAAPPSPRRRLAVPRLLNSRRALAAAGVVAVGAGLGGAAVMGHGPGQGAISPTTPEQCAAIQAAWTASASYQVGMTADDPATLRKGFVGARDVLADAPTPSGVADDWALVTHYLDTVAAAVAEVEPTDGEAVTAAVGATLADLNTAEVAAASARITTYLTGGCAG